MQASTEENRNTIIAEIHRARHIPVEELQNKWTQELIDIVCFNDYSMPYTTDCVAKAKTLFIERIG